MAKKNAGKKPANGADRSEDTPAGIGHNRNKELFANCLAAATEYNSIVARIEKELPELRKNIWKLVLAIGEIRGAYKSDRAFGVALRRNGLGPNVLSHEDRAAAIHMAEHPELSQEVLAKTERHSIRHIWEQEIKPLIKDEEPAEEGLPVGKENPDQQVPPEQEGDNGDGASEETANNNSNDNDDDQEDDGNGQPAQPVPAAQQQQEPPPDSNDSKHEGDGLEGDSEVTPDDPKPNGKHEDAWEDQFNDLLDRLSSGKKPRIRCRWAFYALADEIRANAPDVWRELVLEAAEKLNSGSA